MAGDLRPPCEIAHQSAYAGPTPLVYPAGSLSASDGRPGRGQGHAPVAVQVNLSACELEDPELTEAIGAAETPTA